MIISFSEFLEKLMRLGLEYFRRYYGPYRARVISNVDPENRGRVLVECPRARLLAPDPSSASTWALPMMAGAGPGHGEFWPPEKGSVVWVFFDNGDPTAPLCYLGGWYVHGKLDDDIKPKGAPVKRGWVTPGGNKIILDDTSGSETITITQKDGKIIKITGSKISVGTKDGSFEPMMKGNTVKQWLETHTHPHSWGPTGAPIQPFPPAGLSKDTETT
jgi:hypothetical protein